jgi:hypothetical protein
MPATDHQPTDTQRTTQRPRGRPFLPGNKFGKGRVIRGTARRARAYAAIEADLIRITGAPLSATEALLLNAAIEQLDISRLKRTHAAERCTANGLRTISKLVDARNADKPAHDPLRLDADSAAAIAAIFNGDANGH